MSMCCRFKIKIVILLKYTIQMDENHTNANNETIIILEFRKMSKKVKLEILSKKNHSSYR